MPSSQPLLCLNPVVNTRETEVLVLQPDEDPTLTIAENILPPSITPVAKEDNPTPVANAANAETSLPRNIAPVHLAKANEAANQVTLESQNNPQIPGIMPANEVDNYDANCSICRMDVDTDDKGVLCEMCKVWIHKDCLHLSEEQYLVLCNTKDPWFCSRCTLIKSNKVKWGKLEGEEAVKDLATSIYTMMLDWNKNIFFLPRGRAGSEFIRILTELLNHFNNKTRWERLALPLVHVFVPLMLQRPSANSKPKENSKYLLSRIERW